MAVEVELALRRQNVPMTRETLDVAGRLAGEVLVAVTSLPSEHRLALDSANELLSDAISRLVLSLAIEMGELQRCDQSWSGGKIAARADAETKPQPYPGRFALVRSWAGEVVAKPLLRTNSTFRDRRYICGNGAMR
ncbi:hypothetical protein [Mesorhizobium sp. B4-1-4]|uniref:hypothetical protein n=1 Tax=Mesorhizobium sp. B4-1-4 TaxID=2589888 RepID=UPI00112DAC8D|nr:hypothetical protein [Mesorhizobium sp. B4-1-4]UCI31755.1 hypothetical protein FJW03_29035 [Mesorhizobium sp. B4-1-4]